jgi:hypothetical protein
MIGEYQEVSPTGQERRRSPRAKYSIVANFLVEGQVYSDHVQNISMGGASIRFSGSVSFREEQQIALAFPSGKSQRQIDGKIVWVKPEQFGVVFERVGAKCTELNLFEVEAEKKMHTPLEKEEPRTVGRIRKKRIRWEPSGVGEVTGYKLYWSKDAPVNYGSQSAYLGNVTEVILPDGVPSFPVITGEVNLGITAIDSAGNESGMIEITTRLNFSIPEAPRKIEVEDV